MRLKSIEIKSVWGYRCINTNFFKDTNIFIGNNGTGKTTFLNIIESVLTVDLEQLYTLIFDEVIINISDDTKRRKLKVKKQLPNLGYPIIEYQVGTKKYSFPILREYEMRNMGRLNPRTRNEIKSLRDEISCYINICWLSVHREVTSLDESEYGVHREQRERNTIDQRLSDLMRRLTIYQLQLESESSRLSNKFRELVFESLLYKEEFDEIDLTKLQSVDPEEIKRQLIKAYKELGLSTKETQERITLHSQKIAHAIKKIERAKVSKEAILVNDVTPLSLLNRTLSVINISVDIDKQKREIFKPIDAYLRILEEFVPDKIFKLDTESSGELKVFGDIDKNKITALPIKYLSSGEKQLIILLTESLLQRNTDYIFIADEPELSLHILWQRKILGSIRELNEKAQIIVATHSPEIAGRWKKRIINMENILSYGKV
jgi:predicted ATP-binding protein involved in virulence